MSTIRLLLALTIHCGVIFGQFAQQTTPSTARHQFTGTVVNAATGEPLRKALVSLQTQEGQHAGFTDASGHFAIENVPDGQYGVSCQKPGFYPPNQNSTFGPQAMVMITVSASAPAATLRLVPAASIVGRVIDEQGQPVENANLQLSTSLIQNGEKHWIPGKGATTDEDGSYELDNLAPDTYRLRLGMQMVPQFTVASRKANAKRPKQVYPTQYYPAGSEASASQPLMLKAGQTERADFTIKAVPAFRVSGTLVPYQPGAFPFVEDADGNPLDMGVEFDGRTGQWAFSALPSGTWTIGAQLQTQAEQLFGDRLVSVNSADIVNVTVQLMPMATIPVKIMNSSEGSSLALQLTQKIDSGVINPNTYQASPPPGTAPSPAASELLFTNVRPGAYRLHLQPFGSACVEGVHAEGTDIARDGLTLAPGQTPAPIEVTVRSDCATLMVKLNNPGVGQKVSFLLLSNDPIVDPSQSTTEGTFSFANLAPGTYRVYAFDGDINNLEYANQEVMRSYPAREVTLAANQHAEVTLDLIHSSELAPQ